jgi:hypothetical protein
VIHHCVPRVEADVALPGEVFHDGAIIGSKEFVNAAFESARERFGPRRKDGARRMRGSGDAAKGLLWSARDLRQGIS